MLKRQLLFLTLVILMTGLLGSVVKADPVIPITAPTMAQPTFTPIAPNVNAKAYLLMDAYSGKILASKNIDEHLAPASLTKMMTSYVVSMALQQGRIHLTDLVPISEAAWKTGALKCLLR